MFNTTHIGTICCIALSATLGQVKVAFQGNPRYSVSTASYFSTQQEAVQPACIVSPETALDVSKAIKSLADMQDKEGRNCLFAVRSGGHSSWAGASSIQSGPVLDLGALHSIQLSTDRSTVSVGVGASWGDVYEALGPYGLAVNGGRAFGVGVGGLTLGGGISYTSPRYGWTCDTVDEFEIVFGNGTLAKVDEVSNLDLFTALKGGNNNFGVVTNVKLRTFQQDQVWFGTIYNSLSYSEDIISQFAKLNTADLYDEYASFITTFGYSQARDLAVVSNQLAYTGETMGRPATYDGYYSIPNVYNVSSVMNMTALARATEALQPDGLRYMLMTRTLVSKTAVLQAAYEAWNATYPAVKNVSNIIFGLSLEPLPPAFYQRRRNSLSLSSRTEPLVIALISVSWISASDDALVDSTAHALLAEIEIASRARGGLDEFIYLNYADSWQEPIRSYGNDTVERLNNVRRDVDPRHVFTKQVPGGYKIPSE